MKNFTIKRVCTSEEGTFGVLLYANEAFALTLEDPWRNNKPFESCIPAGTYQCERVNSPKFGNTFEIMSVPRRDHILFHWGNIQEDTEGCILVGEEFGILQNHWAVLSSKRGFEEFLARTEREDEFILNIIWV